MAKVIIVEDDLVIADLLEDDIVRALGLVQEMVETGTTTKPFPFNFELLRQSGASHAVEALGHGDRTA